MPSEKTEGTWVTSFEASLLYGINASSLQGLAQSGKIGHKRLEVHDEFNRNRLRQERNVYRVLDIVRHFKLEGPLDSRVYNSGYLKEIVDDVEGDFTFTRHLAQRCLDLERELSRRKK